MGGQVRIVHVTVLGVIGCPPVWRFAGWRRLRVGLGLLSGRGGPTFFVFLGVGVPVCPCLAEGGCVAVWLVACGLRPPGRLGARDWAGYGARVPGG